MARSDTSRQISYLLALVAAVIVVAVLYLAKTVVVPLALAILFTFLLAPLVTLLERLRIPRVIAIVLVMFSFFAMVGWIGWTVGNQLMDMTAHLPVYRTNIADKLTAFHKTSTKDSTFTRAEKEVDRLGKQLGISDTGTEPKRRERDPLLGTSSEHPLSVREVQPSGRLDLLHGVLGDMIAFLLVAVFTFFMLLQREDLRNRIIRLTGRGNLNLMTQAMDEAGRRVSRYFALQLLVNTGYGAIIFTALHFIGLPHALLFGALAGLLRFIPYIGAPIAGLLPTFFSMAAFHGWTQTFLIMALFFCMEVLTANFIEPHIYGKQTGLSSLAILVAAVFWTLIWGPIGLILSVPLTVCLVVVGSHVTNLGFLKVLLGDEPVMRPEAHYYQRLLAGDEHEASRVLENCLKDMSLTQLYDSVVIPAIELAEMDRHRDALDEATVEFIYQTTQDLIGELSVSYTEPVPTPQEDAEDHGAKPSEHFAAAATSELTVPMNAVCIPVRDEADEVAAQMLAQLLDRAGHHARTIQLNNADRMLADALRAKPDVVFLSAVPPYAMSHARGIYRRLRSEMPQSRIVIGFWQYSGDKLQAARHISRGEQDDLWTTLADAVSHAGVPATQDETASPQLPSPPNGSARSFRDPAPAPVHS